MSWGFYQLAEELASQEYKASSTPFGTFMWLRMLMGLTGSPNTFQSLVQKVLMILIWNFTLPYLDDCIISLVQSKAPRMPSRNFSNVQRRQSQNQSNQM